MSRGRWYAAIVSWVSTAACGGPLSTLAPAGREAEDAASLFVWMTVAAAVLWTGLVALLLYATSSTREITNPRTGSRLIAAGFLLPVTLLPVLLVFGLRPLARADERSSPPPFSIDVAAEQWWWRVRYAFDDGRSIPLANEIHLPVGAEIPARLTSHNVIHSFWIPALAGKVDMIPGRSTRLLLAPTRTGEFQGVCAEYCGASHAFMAFTVVAHEQQDFDRWLLGQAQPAREPANESAERGSALFFRHGCAACHAIRGTSANGVVGPDLTHVGSRARLAAGARPNHPEALIEWISAPSHVKPEATMPDFAMIGRSDLTDIAAYLHGLQ